MSCGAEEISRLPRGGRFGRRGVGEFGALPHTGRKFFSRGPMIIPSIRRGMRRSGEGFPD